VRWTYDDLQAVASRIAHVLVDDMGLVPGNRVLLRGANSPMLAACWFAVMKAGGIAVGTMPMLRAKELGQIVAKAEVSHALCDARLVGELEATRAAHPVLREVATFLGDGLDRGGIDLETRLAGKPPTFATVDTHRDDTCLIAFTSGTTGVPKGTMHFHRDVIASCLCWPPHVLRPTRDDIFIGSPPLAFTFGLGGLLLFPLHIGASTVLLEKASPDVLPAAIARYGATVCFTAPTSYRAMAAKGGRARPLELAQVRERRRGAPGGDARALEAGHGHRDDRRHRLDRDAAHLRLARRGPCRARRHRHGRPRLRGEGHRRGRPGGPGRHRRPPRRAGPDRLPLPRRSAAGAVRRERMERHGRRLRPRPEGRFVYQARTDDMIISGGYNIAGPEVESALLLHPAVSECAVIGVRDAERGEIVKAFVVLREGQQAGDAMARELQDFVKRTIAPYKYPRAMAFVDALPKTETGKLQRFRLKTLEFPP
jgi:2-aminobenzoate-CoA ligase